jgi:hypothetical protein
VLPALAGRRSDARAAEFLRTAARVHAAIGQLEVATVGPPEDPRAALLTLLDGADRWPWLGLPGDEDGDGGLRRVLGAPLVSLTATGGPRPPHVPWPARPPRLPRPAELTDRLRGAWRPGGSR